MKLSNSMKIVNTDFVNYERMCEMYLKAKQTRLHFGKVRMRATRPLALIQTDVYGPMECKICDDKRYILTFIDVCTHYAMTYLLRHKSGVAETIKEYVQNVEAH